MSQTDNEVRASKFLTIAVLLYMIYIVYGCPCKPLYECHEKHLYAAIGFIVANLVYFNSVPVVRNYM